MQASLEAGYQPQSTLGVVFDDSPGSGPRLRYARPEGSL